MNTLHTPTQEWKCSCEYAGAKLFKQENDMDYKFFFNHYTDAIQFFVSQGHSKDICLKVVA